MSRSSFRIPPPYFIAHDTSVTSVSVDMGSLRSATVFSCAVRSRILRNEPNLSGSVFRASSKLSRHIGEELFVCLASFSDLFIWLP